MKNGREIAKRYMELGLNPLPISPDKKAPMNEEHNTVPLTLETMELYPFDAIGVSTGVLSGGLEAIDFDLKNASDPSAIMKVFKWVPLYIQMRGCFLVKEVGQKPRG
jgi:hypothetical protein